MFDRREFVKASGAAVAGTALLGRATAESVGYEFITEAVNPVNRTLVMQDGVAYTSNRQGLVTIDFSDPTAPVPLGAASARGTDNNDVKVSGDLAGAANDGDPPGVTIFDVSDPASPTEVGHYPTSGGVHNHDVHEGYAYVCVNDSEEASFSEARVEIVDLSDPAEPTKVSQWKLEDHYPAMAHTGLNVAHDVYVADQLAYICFWDAGVVVVDVTDPAAPVAVGHVGALENADIAPRSTTESQSRYIGAPGNAHYAEPSPDGNFLFVGAETYPDPTGTALPPTHGGVRIFDLRGYALDSPIATASQQGRPVDPTREHDAYIAAPEEPQAAPLRCSHNFDFDPVREEFYCCWYQGGVRAYDVSDPLDPTELASFVSPDGNAFWRAANLPTAPGEPNYTLGSERDGKGIVVLELTEGATELPTPPASAFDRPAPSDVFTGSAAQPLDRED